MGDREGDLVDQAIAWHLRLDTANDREWRDFVDWIGQSEAHAAAYDRVTMDDSLLAPEFVPMMAPVAANDVGPAIATRRRWFGAAGGAIAAALVAALLLPTMRGTHSDPFEIMTQPGTQRILTLDDGTRVEMSGGTRMRFDHANPRVAELESGEALFHVRHDAANPFTLRSGKVALQDLGTVFDVTREGQRLGVQVAEGAVMYQPSAEAVTLRGGMGLTLSEDRGEATIGRIAAADVGSWRDGRLVFEGAPAETVARAIERGTGARVTLSPGLAAAPFTGTIRLAGGADAVVPRFAALLDAHVLRTGDGWSLTARDDDAR